MSQDESADGAVRETAPPAAAAGGPGPNRQVRGLAGPPIAAAARARIGRALRLHYAEALDLPIPERLRALVDRLADAEAPGRPDGHRSAGDHAARDATTHEGFEGGKR